MSKKAFLIITISIVIVVLAGLFIKPSLGANNFQVVFFDVGQGDSHFIRTPGGQNILIDGGPDNTVLAKLAEYMPLRDRTIDLMILTHPHADHVSGLVEVIRRYKVERVLATSVAHTTDEYLEWLSLIKENNIKFDSAVAPRQYVFESSRGNVVLDVLYPDRDVSNEEFEDLNESSVTVMASYKNKKFLLTGDISVDIEKRILQNICHSGLDPESILRPAQDDNVGSMPCDNLKADVLKVAHQGSETSSSEEWLEVVKPDYAVIPVGENDYGHPSLRIIRRLERAGIDILRTDQQGDVRFVVDKTGSLILQ